jgi:glutathione S-transferase
MLTFFHSPLSRSGVIAALIDEMGITDRIATRIVTIPRVDGTGARDPANPHPEGKVPALLHDGRLITERAAIILHLTGQFPGTTMAPAPGTPDWGVFATWLCWYQGVMEPALICAAAGIDHPWMTAAIRGHVEVADRLEAALAGGPWLMGDRPSAADLLCHGPYGFFPDMVPDSAAIRDWVARCLALPSIRAVAARDLALLGAPA